MERFDVLDTDGTVIGVTTREECHNGSFLLHGVVHVLVFTPAGELILQKRSRSKAIQPGKWDTSVGGHINAGETKYEAVIREAVEELGIRGAGFEELYTYIMESDIERELVTTFRCTWDGPIDHNREEIEDVGAFSPDEIERRIGTGFFTPNFEEEWGYYKEWLEENKRRPA